MGDSSSTCMRRFNEGEGWKLEGFPFGIVIWNLEFGIKSEFFSKSLFY